MSKIVLKAENIGKSYIIGHEKKERYVSLRDVIVNSFKNFFKKTKNVLKGSQIISGDNLEEFWALRDINLELNQGDRLGIIGMNGAGKSTLLKVLSRITNPTEGIIKIKGRVSSLLEVGTGFHPELTGRENIYLNGAILGMKRSVIKKKFNEIVNFSGVENFIDTPVKRYSSGMYVRLAFAVAAHLESEIMIIDEVLAVGDAEFQKKCLGKMEDVNRTEDRTVLFVSHNMSSIQKFCSTAILIDKGKIIMQGRPDEVVQAHLKNCEGDKLKNSEKTLEIDTNKEFQITKSRVLNNKGVLENSFECDDEIFLEFDCVSRTRVPGLYGYLSIDNNEGENIWVSDTFDKKNRFDNLEKGNYTINLTIPNRVLGHGQYLVKLVFQSGQSFNKFFIDDPGYVCGFNISDNNTERGDHRKGKISTLLDWKIKKNI